MTKIQSSLGKTIIFLAKFLNLFRKKPVVLDAFLSLYDTIISDRGLVSPGSVKARVIWWLDRMSCRLADLVLLDTEEHIKFFVSEFGINSDKFVRVFVGAAEAMLRLKADKALCETIGKRAERLYQEQCFPKAIGRDLKPHLERLIS